MATLALAAKEIDSTLTPAYLPVTPVFHPIYQFNIKQSGESVPGTQKYAAENFKLGH